MVTPGGRVLTVQPFVLRQDTVTGILLAGIGDCDPRKNATNFLMVDKSTSLSTIEAAFRSFTSRTDIAIILITQAVCFRAAKYQLPRRLLRCARFWFQLFTVGGLLRFL